MPVLGAGELNQRIDFQSKVRVDDEGGGYSESWEPVFEGVWAKVEPFSAVEVFRAQQVQAEESYRITIRNQFEVNTGMRIVWDGEVLNIRQAPRPAGGTWAEYRELIAQAGVST